jgi:hypothetical protein
MSHTEHQCKSKPFVIDPAGIISTIAPVSDHEAAELVN